MNVVFLGKSTEEKVLLLCLKLKSCHATKAVLISKVHFHMKTYRGPMTIAALKYKV